MLLTELVAALAVTPDNGSSITGRFYPNDKINANDEFTVIK
jgi:hypothetical protein